MELLSFPFLVQQSPLVEVGSSLPREIRLLLLQCAASSREVHSAPCDCPPGCRGHSLRGGGTDPNVPSHP